LRYCPSLIRFIFFLSQKYQTMKARMFDRRVIPTHKPKAISKPTQRKFPFVREKKVYEIGASVVYIKVCKIMFLRVVR